MSGSRAGLHPPPEEPQLRPQPAALPGRRRAAHPRQLRLRFSSREHAPWALRTTASGHRRRVSPTSSSTTASRTACCPSSCRSPRSRRCSSRSKLRPATAWWSTSPAQAVVRPTVGIPFDIDAFRKECLLNGWDDIGLTLRHADKIKAFEKTRGSTNLAVRLPERKTHEDLCTAR